MSFYYEAACICDMGRVRQNNEDNFFFNGQYMIRENTGLPGNLAFTYREDPSVFAVFDGMGGHDDGQIASYLCSAFMKKNASVLQCRPGNEKLFTEFIRKMNQVVSREAEKNGSNMGSTAAIAVFSDESLTITNVGDSRIYRLRDGKLEQLSLDHLEELPADGSRHKARLTQCIGIPEEEMAIIPYINSFSVREGDIYLLCSDGLTDMLTDPEISMLLSRSPDLTEKAESLRKAAMQRGGKDNTTVVLVQIRRERENNSTEIGK